MLVHSQWTCLPEMASKLCTFHWLNDILQCFEHHKSVYLIAYYHIFFYRGNDRCFHKRLANNNRKHNKAQLRYSFTIFPFLVTKRNHQQVPRDISHSQVFAFITGFAIKNKILGRTVSLTCHKGTWLKCHWTPWITLSRASRLVFDQQ